jgi:flagellar basal-body rod protein FlgF
MDTLTIAAASGLRSRMEALDVLANNLANAATSGFKSDREFYNLFTGDEASDRLPGASPLSVPVIEKQWTDFSQGVLQPTGNPYDLAISGRGFFVVNGPSGPLYTRNGSFQVSADGELVTTDQYPVQDAGGKSIRLTPGKTVDIATDGTVRQEGVLVGRIAVVDFKNTSGLRKMGATMFQNTLTNNPPAATDKAEVQQGKLENSNVAVAEAAMRLVGTMRQFEMLQKAVGLSAEMGRRSIEEVAKVG